MEKQYLGEEPLKILVIGNGFDLAHGLKTTYDNFLDYCQSVKNIVESPFSYTRFDKEQAEKLKRHDNGLYLEFAELLNCFWILHFFQKRTKMKKGWLSFEDEIKTVINEEYSHARSKGFGPYYGSRNSIIAKCQVNSGIEVKTYQESFRFLYDELKRLNRALEIYLDVIVRTDTKKAKQLSVISRIKPDYVLSFNYTDTYFELYGKDEETCYIHGKADARHKISTNNLVLGFDDHYMSDAQNALECIPFQKYYQRVVKHTENNYFEWFEKNDALAEYMKKRIDVVFFGHSLSPADGDVIKKIVTNEKAYTRVLYRENYQNDLESLIQNMAFILGPEDFIKLAGGSNPRIQFESYKEEPIVDTTMIMV